MSDSIVTLLFATTVKLRMEELGHKIPPKDIGPMFAEKISECIASLNPDLSDKDTAAAIFAFAEAVPEDYLLAKAQEHAIQQQEMQRVRQLR
jgi:hypothetical protein